MASTGGSAQTAQQLNADGVRALDAGDAARAAELFRRAIGADGHAPALWLNLAKACGYPERAVLEPRFSRWDGLADYQDGQRRAFFFAREASLEAISAWAEL